MSEIVILGAGLAGLSAAYHLRKDYEMYEKNNKIGGLCRSRTIDNFVFDYGAHILFPKGKYITDLIKKLLSGQLRIQSREAWIYHKYCDLYTRFPFQAHLFGLPVSVVKDCIMGLFNASGCSKPNNYEEWINWQFGAGIANHLMIPYANKLWTVSPETMNYGWVGDRVPRANIEEVLDGALSDNSQQFGFNTEFWYPLKGGIESLPRSFLPRIGKVNLEKAATRIKINERNVEFNGNDNVSYERLVSTLPLPDVIKLIDIVPEDVKKAAEDLQHNSVMCVSLGIERKNITDKHWIYFYEDDFAFYRISFPMNFSCFTVPKNHSSVTTEIAYSRHKLIPKENIIEKVVEDLIKSKVIYPDDNIVVTDVVDIKYAYIIYDHNHRKNVAKIHDFLRSYDIYPCGRFGEWEYFNMDLSMESGMKTALEINRNSREK